MTASAAKGEPPDGGSDVAADQHERIAATAYALWQRRGSADGSADDDWLAAERTVRGEADVAAHSATTSTVDKSSADSFPASDPPASHRPDIPPSNADSKWKAAGETPATTPQDRNNRAGSKR